VRTFPPMDRERFFFAPNRAPVPAFSPQTKNKNKDGAKTSTAV